MAASFGLRSFRAGRQIFSSPSTLIATRQSGAPAVRSYSTSDHLPKIADTSVWTAMIPRFLRNRSRKDPTKEKSKEWNPATFYIIIFTLIGSQAIRMITLKNSYAAYTRSTDAKIELLREVIARTKNGEKVDVEKLLGTGDEAKEREWDEVLREIEAEDSLWHQKSAESKSEEPKTEKTEKTPKRPAQRTPEKDSETTKTESTRKTRFY
ncbi:hypothetical protein PENANT_c034G05807 [Penicillium antarcticum]|uniref:Uncharacterized protein n=1 Tax=Penicillium antarcticum TaxID=416450 RepID=A0A1V6PU90_9EURO|nr:uncharacterized protein N7508_001850 [Penicillium antarcticum]KAJ5317342.1 hypothetical protein N7508_001850 [Penicillium antarcticum]OQD80619.1 hypothetical protein PENANT_c034G05807 [Penicillium antarcticum]